MGTKIHDTRVSNNHTDLYKRTSTRILFIHTHFVIEMKP